MNLIEEIRAYQPFNIQEEKDRINILRFLETHEDAFERKNEIAHMTASAWVVDPSRTKVLMAYHRIYDSWSWLGGHCDGERDCLKVALKEVREEAGIEKDLVTIGVLDHLEIWAKEVYDAARTGGLMKSDDFVGMSGKFPI